MITMRQQFENGVPQSLLGEDEFGGYADQDTQRQWLEFKRGWYMATAIEREACARVAENYFLRLPSGTGRREEAATASISITGAIRARGPAP